MGSAGRLIASDLLKDFDGRPDDCKFLPPKYAVLRPNEDEFTGIFPVRLAVTGPEFLLNEYKADDRELSDSSTPWLNITLQICGLLLRTGLYAIDCIC